MAYLLIVFMCISIIASIYAFKRYTENRKLLSQKKKSEVVLGLISEKLAPFLNGFNKNLDPQNLVFIGKPIDYIHFGDDVVTFIEIKSGNSKLSKGQRKIKSIICNKKVDWYEFRVTGNINDSSSDVQQ